MTFMLDNYDSFTYNLVQYLSELGAEVKVARNDEITVADIEKMSPRAIVLSPGPGRPHQAGIMNELIKTMAGRIPILGVCLGHQGIGEVFGATIDHAPSLMHGKTSPVTHDGSKLFKSIPSPFIATRYHSLVIKPGSLPDDFTVTAQSADGVIQAIEHKTMPLYGFQYHPESIMTPDGKLMLRNFLDTL